MARVYGLRHAPQPSLSSLLPPRKKYSLRRLHSPEEHSDPFHNNRGSTKDTNNDTEDEDQDASRGVLLPLHLNLRRLPSRLLPRTMAHSRSSSQQSPTLLHTKSAGNKRKRSNENAHLHGRPARGFGRTKRRKANHGSRQVYSSDEDEGFDDDVDLDSSCDHDSYLPDDHYFLNSAPESELLRLRKDELVRLHTLCGLSDDDLDAAKKADLVDAIISARDDVPDMPPSSPRAVDDDDAPSSSGYDSDDGLSDHRLSPIFPPTPKRPTPNMKRRATTTGDPTHSVPRPIKGRTMSWIPNQVQQSATSHVRKASLKVHQPINSDASSFTPASRRLRTSPTDPYLLESVSSPVATRLRTRKRSSPGPGRSPSSPSTTSFQLQQGEEKEPVTPPLNKTRRTRAAKHVEFSNSALHFRTQRDMDNYLAQESDLTDIDENQSSGGQAGISLVEPSPRRLRSKDRKESLMAGASAVPSVQPIILDISSDEEEDSQVEVDEVDELVSTASYETPRPSRPRFVPVERTPVKRRLRSSDVKVALPEEDVEPVEDDDDANVSEGQEMEGGASEDEEELEDDDSQVFEGRRLRSGKIVGEDEDVAMQTADEGSVASDDDSEAGEPGDEELGSDAGSEEELQEEEDEENAGEEEDEEMGDDDIDLSDATRKTLTRLRRDDLVRLCETRDLEPVGTKLQMADSLLQWRDRHQQFSEPSSTATLRPPCTVVKRARKAGKRQSSATSEPKTPAKESEPDIELDLESLGLDDREIPPEKIVKLEKIGSGGFKDVFIGKYKGRKVAISEFRGQLTSMDIKELKLLGGFAHPNIVRFLGVSIPENTRETPVMIVSELCSNGDLFDYIRNVPPPSLSKLLQLMLDIARGLEYLHNRKPSIIHRDCKSSNILISSKVTAKIADFGLAKVKQSTRSMVRSLVGTVNWQAPELWHPHPKYNHKVDVFSLAIVFWEMLQWHVPTKKFPWEGMNEHAIYEAVGAKHQRPSIIGLKKLWCPEIVELMESMWAHDPQDRPTMSEVVISLKDWVEKYRRHTS